MDINHHLLTSIDFERSVITVALGIGDLDKHWIDQLLLLFGGIYRKRIRCGLALLFRFFLIKELWN